MQHTNRFIILDIRSSKFPQQDNALREVYKPHTELFESESNDDSLKRILTNFTKIVAESFQPVE